MTKLTVLVLLLTSVAACSRDYSYRLRPNPPFCESIGKDCR